MNEIKRITEAFIQQLTQVVATETRDRVLIALGGKPDLSPLRMVPNPVPPSKSRRKGPIQLCPVRGCTNRAAPVFGMVCSKHKDLPKATIKKYREARRKRAEAAK